MPFISVTSSTVFSTRVAAVQHVLNSRIITYTVDLQSAVEGSFLQTLLFSLSDYTDSGQGHSTTLAIWHCVTPQLLSWLDVCGATTSTS